MKKKCALEGCKTRMAGEKIPAYCPDHNFMNTPVPEGHAIAFPMGITQWWNYGKKYGYPQYFIEKILELSKEYDVQTYIDIKEIIKTFLKNNA